MSFVINSCARGDGGKMIINIVWRLKCVDSILQAKNAIDKPSHALPVGPFANVLEF